MANKPLICVVDDDDSVRKALVSLILSMGYHCTGYPSVETSISSGDALTAACVITDIHMPGLDGFAFKQMLTSRGCQSAVIMITGRSDKSLERRALAAGASFFLQKPLRTDALSECLAMILGEE